ncbi:FAD-binding oxidoreductase [Amycolatopsis sp. H20-H5]|uniref:FAD-binding oxidoreductase n=1 Tax=Amycolatopsis sp. H20-H5 TaxID=3046309 RepID=UPI002DBD579D|nr:FAD-binding oxidoreductase [Amycolatopsis sp. H20-H5]MEC3975248.1 FAD-binding oxidoreductase [Amycolatopsis sp. H20-H5]
MSETTLDLTKLTEQVDGPVFVPGEAGYADETAGFQTGVRHRPAVIVGATSQADVVAAVEFAGLHGLAVAVQATGHGLTVPAEGGLLISTRRLTGIEVDAAARTVRIEAGVLWGAVIAEAAKHDLAPLSGSSPGVGAVGYTLGGGFGLLSRQFGLATDHVRALDVVTADGRARHVTAESEPDLFWALRGGRDNFGVVTSLEVGLVPVTRLYGGGLYFDAAQIGDVLRGWRDWTATVPDELNSSIALIPFPDLPMMPADLRGRHVAHLRIAFTGSFEEGERLVAPLRAAGPVLKDTLGELPFTESGSIASEPPHPHPYHGDNATVSELTDPMIDSILELTGPGSPKPSVLIIDLLGGALSRTPDVPGVGWDRSARFTVRALAVIEEDGVTAVRRRHGLLFEALRPRTTGRLLNFVYGESAAGKHAATVYPAAELRRLAALKAVHDPENLFRVNHNLVTG